MFGHDYVINWDASAGEEAFNNAKSQFLAQVNGSHCSISQPDPDTYIEKINWDPYIDPELIKDLDRVFFNPDEVNKEESNSDSSLKLPENPSNEKNPWESKSMEHNEDLRDKALICKWGANSPGEVKQDGAISSAKCGTSDKGKDPWESRTPEQRDNLWDKALSCNWGASNAVDNNPWEQNNCVKAQKNDQAWEQSRHGFCSVKNNWGRGSEISCWDQNKGNSNSWEMHNNAAKYSRSFSKNSDRRFCNERRWREGSGSSGFQRQAELPGNRNGAWNGVCRKRESSHLNVSSGYNDDYRDRDNGYWNRGRANKRVSFAP